MPTAFTASAPTPPRPSPGVSPSMCLRVTRQGASAFNQPLSLDTSSVTTMAYMFLVRPSPCPAPNLPSNTPLRPACAVARRLPPPRPHLLAPHRTPSV